MFNQGVTPLAVKALVTTVFLFLTGLAAVAQDTPAARPAIEEAYLARDNGSGKPGEPVSDFAIADVPIHCVILLDNPAKVTVKMNFVAVSVSGVKPDTKVVTASYTTKENQNRVNFTGRPDGKWTPGRYRVDIFLDGKQEKQLEFSIKGMPASVPDASRFTRPGKPRPKPKN